MYTFVPSQGYWTEHMQLEKHANLGTVPKLRYCTLNLGTVPKLYYQGYLYLDSTELGRHRIGPPI